VAKGLPNNPDASDGLQPRRIRDVRQENMNAINIDLTTPEGRNAAVEYFDKYGWLVSWPLWLTRHAFKAVRDNATKTTEAQKRAVVEIIQAGRQNGVKKMNIKIDRTAGLDFGSEIDGFPIKMKVGDAGTITIEVEYS
jgi:hypothetical protein